MISVTNPPPLPASAAEAVAGAVVSAGGVPVLRARPLRVLLVGDSLTNEVELRIRVWRSLRRLRGGVRFLGDLGWRTATTGGRIGSTELGDWHHSGVNGNTVEQVTARLTALAAHLVSSGQGLPHVVVLRSGTNNASAQQALEDLVAAKAAEIDLARELWPAAAIFVPSIPPWGPAAGGAWEAQAALRDAYVAALPGLCAARPNVAFVDDCAGMPFAELSGDGIHPNAPGYQRMASRLAEVIDRFAGAAFGETLPRGYLPRPAQASLHLPTDAAYAQAAYDVDLSPQAGSFALSFWVRFTSLPSGIHTILQYGAAYTDGFMVGHDGDGFAVYLKGSGGPVIAGNAGYGDAHFTTDTWHHVAVVFDRANASVGVAIDGRVVYGGRDLSGTGWEAWDVTASHPARVGAAGGLPGMAGYVDNVRLYKGAQAPTIHDLVDFAEQECFDGRCWATPSLALPCAEGSGTTAADVQGTGPVFTLAGGAAWATVAKPFTGDTYNPYQQLAATPAASGRTGVVVRNAERRTPVGADTSASGTTWLTLLTMTATVVAGRPYRLIAGASVSRNNTGVVRLRLLVEGVPAAPCPCISTGNGEPGTGQTEVAFVAAGTSVTCTIQWAGTSPGTTVYCRPATHPDDEGSWMRLEEEPTT